MDWYRITATAVIVGVISPLFWLGVNKFELHFYAWLHRTRFYRQVLPWWLKADVRDLFRRRLSADAAQQLSDPARVGRDQLPNR